MRNRIIAIFVCLLLANVVNYALGNWIEDWFGKWEQAGLTIDGSTLTASRHSATRPDTSLALSSDREALLDFYNWLAAGGGDRYRTWRTAIADTTTADTPFLRRALEIANRTNASRFWALLLLIGTGLLLWGKALRENYRLTPLLYFLIHLGTVALYGSLDAPLYTIVLAGGYLAYFGAIRLFLPVFATEWARMMRPFLTLQLFLLATMAFRGPELVDYWFWTSPLYRLGLTLVTLLSFYFHLSIVFRILGKGNMGTAARYFAYGMPLGFVFVLLGLVLGFYGPEAGASVREINFELVTLPPEIAAAINPEAPFLLTGAGILLGIVSGIGYFAQRIAR